MDDHAYERHPASAIFPETSEEEHKAMVNDIYEHGLNEEIVLCDDMILDGWNRYRACLAAGVPPKFKQWDHKGSVLEYVQRKNLIRRHMTQSQRGMVAETIERLLAEEIKEETRQRSSDGGKTAGRGRPLKDDGLDEKGFDNSIKPLSGTSTKPRNSRKEAAKIAEVSEIYVADAKKIVAASPEVAKEVLQGKKSIPEAKRELGLDKPKRAKRKPKTESTNGPVGKSKVNDELVDDPPDIAKRRRQGKIAPNAIPEVDDPGEDTTSPLDAINEDIAEREAIQADLSDADWLATLPLSSKLEGVPLRTFQGEAIIYRNWEREIKARRVQGKKIWNQIKRKGPFAHRMQRGSDIDPPEKWLRCPKTEDGGCAGEGRLRFGEGEDTKDAGQCTKCSGRGYWIK